MTIHINGRTGILPSRDKSDITIRWFYFALICPMVIYTTENLNTCLRKMMPAVHYKQMIKMRKYALKIILSK